MSFMFKAAVTICSDFGDQENQVCHCYHCFPVYLPWSDGTGWHDLIFLNDEFRPAFLLSSIQYSWAFLVGQMVKNLPAMWEIWVWCLGWEDPLKEESLPVLWPGEFTKSQARLSDFHFSFPGRWGRPLVQFSGLSSFILSSTQSFPICLLMGP